MQIKGVKAVRIYDSRGQPTILIDVKTDKGNFFSSAPSGKSTGKYEAKPYKKTLQEDIGTINRFSFKLKQIGISEFEDLLKIEHLLIRKIGANSLFALESAFLKTFAKERDLPLWKFVNPSLNKRTAKFPKPVGNCIGGGLHSRRIKKPDFQEFLFIPETEDFAKAVEINKKVREKAKKFLNKIDKNFKNKINDENAWETSLENEKVLSLMKDLKENIYDDLNVKLNIGIDIAASTFFKNNFYQYKNLQKNRNKTSQMDYIADLIKNYNVFYIEDPLQEEDFSGFSNLLKKIKNTDSLIVGDDLSVTNFERVERAIEMKSINALIVKPNQNGSLIKVKRIADLCKKNKIKIIVSHRSGETMDMTIADLAFAWQIDYIKTGISGKERDVKLNRLIEIQKGE